MSHMVLWSQKQKDISETPDQATAFGDLETDSSFTFSLDM